MIRAALLALLAALAVAGCGGEAADEPDPETLTGTPWLLVPGGDEWQGASLPSVEFSADDGQATGSGGCNRFGGSYSVDGDALGIGEIASTQMACEPAVMEAEQRFLAALAAVERWAVASGRLTLSGAGPELTFRAASPRPSSRSAEPTWLSARAGAVR